MALITMRAQRDPLRDVASDPSALVESIQKKVPFSNMIKLIFVFKEGIKMRVVTRTSLGHDRK